MRRLTTIRYLLAGLFLWIAITCGSGGQATEPAPGGESISSGAAAEPTTASPTTLSSASALAPVSVADGVTLAARWGSQRTADRAAIYSALRTRARPPTILRRPRKRPLSRAIGARPTRAATCRPLSCPNSGSSASKAQEVLGPTPGAVRSCAARWHGPGCWRRASLICCSSSAISSLNEAMTRSTLAKASSPASCRRRVRCWARVPTRASSESVLASNPNERAKSRTRLGLTTATLSPAASSAAQTGVYRARRSLPRRPAAAETSPAPLPVWRGRWPGAAGGRWGILSS